MTDNKTEDKAISPFIWILIISVFLMIVFLSSEPEPTGTTSVESQPQTIANRFPNLQNVEPDAIISNEISEDLLKTMIQIVQLHGNKCDTVSSAFNSRDGSTFNLKCNLFRYS